METQTLYLTEAHPQPDFLSGLTIFLQCMAQALGEPNICFSSVDFIFPHGIKSAVNLRPCQTEPSHQCYIKTVHVRLDIL